MKSLLDFFANSISFTQIKLLAEDRDFIYGVGHLVWPLQVYGNEPNMEQKMSYLMRAALGALLLASLMMLLAGCEQKYGGEVAGNITSIEFVDGKCPYWEINLNTGSRLGTATLRSSINPGLNKSWNYVLVWTLTNRTFGCPIYTVRVPYEREEK